MVLQNTLHVFPQIICVAVSRGVLVGSEALIEAHSVLVILLIPCFVLGSQL